MRQQSLIEHDNSIVFPLDSFYRHSNISNFAETEYISCSKEASRAAVDFYQLLGYFSGLFFIKSDMDPTTLWRTTALVHILDAILCGVIAKSQRPEQNSLDVSRRALRHLGAGRDLFAAGKKAGAQFIRRQLTIASSTQG